MIPHDPSVKVPSYEQRQITCLHELYYVQKSQKKYFHINILSSELGFLFTKKQIHRLRKFSNKNTRTGAGSKTNNIVTELYSATTQPS